MGNMTADEQDLRDAFAGAALIALAGNLKLYEVVNEKILAELVATASYELADAMLRARKKP
jgi:hypothetical protein